MSSGSSDKAKFQGVRLTGQGPVDFGTAQNTVVTVQSVCDFSHKIDTSLDVFSVVS